jgi:hypothetical protein
LPRNLPLPDQVDQLGQEAARWGEATVQVDVSVAESSRSPFAPGIQLGPLAMH